LNHFRELAALDDPTAGGVVEALNQAARVDGVWGVNTPASRARAESILRDLWERNLVKHGGMDSFGSGVFLIWSYAREKGWTRR
jgi:hypothetical protein